MNILVPTAGPTPAREKANYITSIAKSLEAELHIIHISEQKDTSAGEDALGIFREVGEREGIKVTTVLKSGDVIPTLLTYSKDANIDLIVMGASEGRIVAKWLAADVLEKAKVPVFILPTGFSEAL